jgi:hypothetical protein
MLEVISVAAVSVMYGNCPSVLGDGDCWQGNTPTRCGAGTS